MEKTLDYFSALDSGNWRVAYGLWGSEFTDNIPYSLYAELSENRGQFLSDQVGFELLGAAKREAGFLMSFAYQIINREQELVKVPVMLVWSECTLVYDGSLSAPFNRAPVRNPALDKVL